MQEQERCWKSASLVPYIQRKSKIAAYVKQNYIRVSRIVGGKTATDLENAAQLYAVRYLSENSKKSIV